MVEASIVLPIIILLIVLLLRVFSFYLEILNTGVKEHEKAIAKWDSFDKPTIVITKDNKTVELLKGGILPFDCEKHIETKTYLFNENLIVRAGETFAKK